MNIIVKRRRKLVKQKSQPSLGGADRETKNSLYTYLFFCMYIYFRMEERKRKKKIYKRTIEWGPFCFPSHPWNPYSFLWPPVARTVPVHTHIYPSEILNKSNSHWSEGAGFFRVSAADRGTFISLHVWYLEPPRNKKIQQSADEVYKKRRNCWLGNIDAPKGNK